MGKIITRRGIIGGLLGIIAAPAIVRAESLMPLRGAPLSDGSPLGYGWVRLHYDDFGSAMPIDWEAINVGKHWYIVGIPEWPDNKRS